MACLALVFAFWSHAAHADMYRCHGVQGESVFTGHPEGYAHCKRISVSGQQRLSQAADHHAARVTTTPSERRHNRAKVLRGTVYRITRADGSIEYTNVKPRHGHAHEVEQLFTYIDRCAACSVHSSIDWATVPLDLKSYGKAVRVAAARYGVSPAFLRAVIHAESAFNPNALSHAGAQGLMQLMPGTASDMGVADAFNAAQNIRGGAQYLARLLKDFHGNRTLAAAAYNAGPGAVRKYHGVPPYAETEVYVKRVGTLYRRYAKALGGMKLAVAGKSS